MSSVKDKNSNAAIIVAHNHLSNVSDPSREDIEVTERLSKD
ncbi:JAB domain-containing protein [Lysinibacillus xylanilyticus]